MDGFKFDLKTTVTDELTGLVGVVIARADYLNGEAMYLIQKVGLNKDGEMAAAQWIDAQRIKFAG